MTTNTEITFEGMEVLVKRHNRFNLIVFVLICVALLWLCRSARAEELEPPTVETLDVWCKADTERGMFTAGFTWKFNHLWPDMDDVRHTGGEVAALIDHYRYPALSDSSFLWAQNSENGVPDTDPFTVLPPPC